MSFIGRIKKSSLVSGIGVYFISGIMTAAIPFVLLPILTRYLEPEEYGEVAVFHVWVSLLGALCGLSVHGAAGRKYFDYKKPDSEIGEFIGSCLILLIVSSSVLFLLVAFFSQGLSELIGLSEFWLLIGIPFAFSSFLIQLRLGQWQVRKEAKKFGLFQVLYGLSNMLLSLQLVVVLFWGVDGRLSGLTVSILVFGVLAYFFLKKDGLVEIVWRPVLIMEAVRFGIPLIPHIIGAFLLLTIDRALISTVLGLEQAGYYMVAVQLSMILSVLMDAVNKAYVPWLYERLNRNKGSDKFLIVKITYWYYLFLMFISAVFFIWGDGIVVFFAGEKYAVSSSIVPWIVLAQVFRGMYLMVTNYIFFVRRTAVISLITFSFGSLNVFLVLFFMKLFGLIGAAWALCICMAFQWMVTWFYANKLFSMPWGLGVRGSIIK
uniref:lipopolysaccharide biosynthesis protein n=1 Tax=Marinobacterium profundum TaxID=1714300 RepID=UPI0009E9F04E|nr:oligosaccharide flippase family protein [Marinobacterium profundum]